MGKGQMRVDGWNHQENQRMQLWKESVNHLIKTISAIYNLY